MPGFERRAEMDRMPVHHHLAGVWNNRPGEHLDQRRLAGAVVADYRENLVRVEVEVGMVERGDTPVALNQVACLQDCAGRSRFRTHAETLLIHWSSATATMISTPTANSCQSASRPASARPF